MPRGPGDEEAAASERQPLLVGGRYRMRHRLGSGGTADVFAADDTVLGREVAVKVFRPAAETVTADRFCDEAPTLARLSHPALVTVYDAGRHGDDAYMVTELVRGTTLRNRLTAGPLTTAQTIRLGRALTSALDHVHGCGIIHRDIKPSNILLDELGAPRLADFGLSRSVDERTRSEPGTLVGSLAYMAPEQLLGGGASKASDVYALGLVLLEALTGDTSRRTTPLEAGIGHLLQAPRIPDQVPDSLARLLSLITAQEPQERPDTARMLRLLEEAASSPALTSHPAIHTSRTSTTTATHRAPTLRAANSAAAPVDAAATPVRSAESAAPEPGRQTRRAWLRPMTLAAAGALALAVTGTVLNDVTSPPDADMGNRPRPSLSTPAKTTGQTQPDPAATAFRTPPPPTPATTGQPVHAPDRTAGAPPGSTPAHDTALPATAPRESATATPTRSGPAQQTTQKQKSKDPKNPHEKPEKTKDTKRKK
ncbi:protein kinase [Streptomyces sp. NPDC102467]|uniref:serine/threonine-protein kinase n=1 Tax=Streptomyces sp. NPDC102467 TaxID=3366179 RepID=UPI003817D80B